MSIWPFAKRAEPAPLPHVVIRHVVATKAESREASARAEAVRMELAEATASMTLQQRIAARERAKVRG